MEIVFATQNKHKLEEIQKSLEINTNHLLADLNFFEDIPETENTLVGNALMKARFIHEKFHCNCFADDTGLEIDALHGAPGVYSARYAGPACSFEDNMRKVLSQMEGISNRKAQFKTVIALILDNKEYLFEGSVSGTILEKKSGTQGFGYDPIFLPDGYNESFAEMSAELKNRISHRAVATQKLTHFLHSLAL